MFFYKSLYYSLACATFVFFGAQLPSEESKDVIDSWYLDEPTALEQNEVIQKIENFLQNDVPDLNWTYRELFDLMDAEGFQIYLIGGVIRDLASDPVQKVNDIDFKFVAPKEEFIEFLKKYRLPYTTIPNSYAVIIGARNAEHPLEGYSVTKKYFEDPNNFEFSINGIFYDLKTKTFTAGFEVGFDDIKNKRLRVSAPEMEEWLSSSIQKVFRFWKMVGKGYIYPVALENLIKKHVNEKMAADPEAFKSGLIDYLGNHYSGFDDVVHGCIATMGQEWCEEIVLSQKEAFKERNQFYQDTRKHYTYLPDNNYQVEPFE